MECGYTKRKFQDDIFIYNEDLKINGFPVLKVNTDLDFKHYSIKEILDKIEDNINSTIKKDALNKFIITLDLNLDSSNTNIDVKKIKEINIFCQTQYSHLIEKCIIYNYTVIWKMLLKTVLCFVDKTMRNKICFLDSKKSKELNIF